MMNRTPRSTRADNSFGNPSPCPIGAPAEFLSQALKLHEPHQALFRRQLQVLAQERAVDSC